MLRRMAPPVDDASRRQLPPPPMPTDQLRASALLQHQGHAPSLPLVITVKLRRGLLCGVAQARLGLEPIPRAGDGLDEAGRPPIVVELHTQLADVTIDNVALDLEFAAPDAGEKVFPAQRSSGVGGKEIEQSLLDRRELKVATADADALFDQVDLESIEPDLWHDGDGYPVGSPQERERASHDLVQRERDFDDVVGPALIGAQFQCGVTPASEREDGHAAVGEPAAHDVDERLKEVEVDERQVRRPTVQDVPAVLCIGASPCLV